MKNRYIIVFFISTLMISVLFKFLLWDVNKGLWWDEAVYLSLGRNILKGRYFINFHEESFRPPFLPFIISLCFLFGTESLVKVVVLSFNIVGILATYYLGKTLYSKEMGYIAASVLASFPLYIFFGNKILTESIFITFSSLSVATFYIGIEKKRTYLYYSSLFFGLCFLTKYFSLFLPIFFIVYILLRKKNSIIYEKEIWIGIIIFLLVISPWFILGLINYRNPIGAILDNIKIHSTTSTQPFNLFFINLHKIFGYSILFLPIGIYYLLKNNKENVNLIIITTVIITLILFSVEHHKELRYLISFSPMYAICISYGILNLPKKFRMLGYVLILFFVIQGFFTGISKIYEDRNSGIGLKNSSLLIKELTKPNEYVMSESYPYIYYYSNRKAVRPPNDREKFYQLLEKYNISYVLINVLEPGNPKYLIQELRTNNFEEVNSFFEWGQKVVMIYKKKSVTLRLRRLHCVRIL